MTKNGKNHGRDLWKSKMHSEVTASAVTSESLRFNVHFSGGPGFYSTKMSPFWILIELRMMDVVVTAGAIRHGKLRSNHHHQQTNTQFFYRPD